MQSLTHSLLLFLFHPAPAEVFGGLHTKTAHCHRQEHSQLHSTEKIKWTSRLCEQAI